MDFLSGKHQKLRRTKAALLAEEVLELSTKIIFATLKVKEEFEELQQGKSEDKERYAQLQEAFTALEKNGFSGIQIKKRIIPKTYIQKFKMHNLWKYNLSGGWRLIYSIENQGDLIVAIIVEWLSHKEYEERFGYQ